MVAPMTERISATYLVETSFEPAQAAEISVIASAKGCLTPLLGEIRTLLLLEPLELPEIQRRLAAAQAVGLALELLMPTAPGSPRGKAHAGTPQFDGLEIALKAGRVGQDDHFGTVLSGRVKEML
jgi:hypothetical protein